MRTMRVMMVTGVLLLGWQLISRGQFHGENIRLNYIVPYAITIGCEQTTNIIFPVAIQSVDRGSAWVLAQKASGVENVLQLKAGSKNEVATNVTVITSDGEFYSFLCTYSDAPTSLNVKIEKELSNHAGDIKLNGRPITRGAFESGIQRLLQQPRRGRVRGKGEQLLLSVRGVFIHQDLLWLTFGLLNQSHITYDPLQIRCYIRERKRSKRTAVQEKELVPLLCNGDSTLRGKQRRLFAATFTPFVVPKSQELVMRASEKDGGRPITLLIKGKHLLRAKWIQ